MRIGLIRLAVLFGAAVYQTFAGDCDCNHFPYKPQSCVKTCGGFVLNKATPKDLTTVLGLSKDTTDSIVKLRKDHSLSIDELDSSTKREVIESFGSLSIAKGEKLAEKYSLGKSGKYAMQNDLKIGGPTKAAK